MAQPAAVLSILITANTRQATAALAGTQAQLGKTAVAGSKMGSAIKTGAKVATVAAAGIGYASIKAASDFESSFAEVRKTVDTTEAGFKRLEAGIRDMAKTIPISANELNNLAGQAGALGIKSKDLLRFTKVAAELGITTNLSSEQAADALARLANIMGTKGRKGFERMGSTLVELGNKGASTEAEITAMALRLAATGKQVGLSEAQVLSFSSALASVGIEAEAGGSAYSRAFTKMAEAVEIGGADLDTFAKVAGESSAKFAQMFGKDAAGAMVLFTEGLGRIKKEGGSVFPILKELGINEVRLRNALLSAAGAGDLFRKQLKIGGDEWQRNTALAEEARKRYETFASQVQVLKNNLIDMGISLGQKIMPALKSLTKEISAVFSDKTLSGSEKLQKVAGLLGDAFSKALPKIAEAAGKAGVVAIRAFFDAWRNSGLLAKLVIGGFLLSKMGGLSAFRKVGMSGGAAMGQGMATASAAALGTALPGKLAAFGSKLKTIGKTVLGFAIVAGIADAVTETDIGGFGDRLQQGLSNLDLTGLLIPAPRPLSERYAAAMNAALRGAEPQIKWGDRWFLPPTGRLKEGQAEVVAQLAKFQREAAQVLGKDTTIKPEIKPGAIDSMVAGFQWIRVNGSKDMAGLREKVDFNARLIEKSLDVHSGGGKRALRDNFEAGMASVLKSMRKGKTGVKEGMKLIEHFARVHSDGSKDSIARNMELAKDAIFRTMSRAGQITEAGMKRIYDITVAQLALYGLSPEAALKGDIPLWRPLEQLGPGGRPANPPLRGNPPFFPNRQRGGPIFGGAPTGDSIPAMLERGEYVLNRKAVQATGKKALDQLNFGIASRFQQGGVVAPINVGGPESGLKSIVQVSLDRSREAANSVIRGAAAQAAAASGGAALPPGASPNLKAAMALAQSMGLTITSTTGGDHTAGSYHYQGRAFDAADGAESMAGFFQAVLRRWGSNITELFYDPLGAVKHGSRIPAIGGHNDHVHVAFQKGGPVEMASGGWVRAAKALRGAGFKSKALQTALAVGGAESGGYTDMVGDESLGGSYGPWQVHRPSHPEYDINRLQRDWGYAAKAAYAISDSGTNWQPWTTFRTGAYKGYLKSATEALVASRAGGSDTGVEKAKEQARKRTAKFRRKLAHVKRPAHKLLDKVQGVGIPEGLKGRIGDLTKKSEIYGEFGDRAGQLNLERLTEAGESVLDAEGRPITDLGLIDGKTETEWLTKQLDVLFKLRNSLVRAHNMVVDYREQLSGAIERAKGKLAAVNKKLGRKGLGQQERRKLLLERGGLRKLVGGLEARRGKTNTSRGNILTALEGVQGHPTGGALTRLLSLPPLGTLGGQIFDTQVRLKELGVKPAISDAATPEVSESAELLRELLREANLETAVSQAQYPEFLRYMGAFQKGGVALVGETGPELAHMPSGTRVHSASDTQQMLAPNLSVIVNGDIVGTPRGKDPVEVLLNDRRFDAAVRNVRSSRPRPGRAGGR